MSDAEARDLRDRMEALDAKLDAVLSGLASLRVGGLDTLTVAEVCAVLKLGRTKVNELVQAGELGMWMLGGERRITRDGLDAFVRRQAAGGHGARLPGPRPGRADAKAGKRAGGQGARSAAQTSGWQAG